MMKGIPFGMKPAELSALALGGLIYGSSQSLMFRFARPVFNAVNMFPIVGHAVPSVLLGLLANWGSKQVKGKTTKKVLSNLGLGLVGSSAVGVGVSAAQYGARFVPGLVPVAPGAPMSGVTYHPGTTTMTGLGEYEMSPGDWGSQVPQMGLIPQGLGASEYSEANFGKTSFHPYGDMSGVDYTEEQFKSPDFGELPVGLG